MIYPSQTIQLRPELQQYRDLCNKYGYQPNKEEFEDIVNFLLLYHTGIGHTCESSDVDRLYSLLEMDLLENSIDQELLHSDMINEGSNTYADLSKEKDTALGMIGLGVATAGGIAVAGAAAAGMFIQFLFKRGKVKGLAKAELAATMKKLEPYQLIYKKKQELAKLKGEDFDGIGSLPGIPEAPAMEEKPEGKE